MKVSVQWIVALIPAFAGTAGVAQTMPGTMAGVLQLQQNGPSADMRLPVPQATAIAPGGLTAAEAETLVREALHVCEVRGETPSAIVTDQNGNIRAALTSDRSSLGSLRYAAIKVNTVLAFHLPTSALKARAATDQKFADDYIHDTRYYFAPGGLPIYKSGKLVAILAVGGAHDQDEPCALEALKSVTWATTKP